MSKLENIFHQPDIVKYIPAVLHPIFLLEQTFIYAVSSFAYRISSPIE